MGASGNKMWVTSFCYPHLFRDLAKQDVPIVE
jgi:hypothetical protein